MDTALREEVKGMPALLVEHTPVPPSLSFVLTVYNKSK